MQRLSRGLPTLIFLRALRLEDSGLCLIQERDPLQGAFLMDRFSELIKSTFVDRDLVVTNPARQSSLRCHVDLLERRSIEAQETVPVVGGGRLCKKHFSRLVKIGPKTGR